MELCHRILCIVFLTPIVLEVASHIGRFIQTSNCAFEDIGNALICLPKLNKIPNKIATSNFSYVKLIMFRYFTLFWCFHM